MESAFSTFASHEPALLMPAGPDPDTDSAANQLHGRKYSATLSN